MGWVKASERLPDKKYSFGNNEFGCFPVRWEFEHRIVLGIGYLDEKTGTIFNSYNRQQLHDVEWLDESPSPSIEELAQKLREANPYKASSAFHEETWDQCIDILLELSKQQTNG